MNENHRDLISISFSLGVVVLAGIVALHFLLPLVWAGVIAIATWPVVERLERWLGYRKTVVAMILTLVVALVVMIPLVWLTIKGLHEVRVFASYLMQANDQAIQAPEWFKNLPWGGDYLQEWWQTKLGHDGAITELFDTEATTIRSLRGLAKTVGVQVAHRSVIFGFALVCLFFFYRDGEELAKQMNAFGEYCLAHRWSLYASNLPSAIKATVNGLVLVGLGVGVIMGVLYASLGVPFSVMLGAATALLAMIPFGAPVAFVAVALILLVKGSFAGAVAVLVVGSLVMFIADHFVRPVIIGSATQLHFLAVLFGILGGVETLGLVGLFISPVVMVLFSTLWREPTLT